MNSVWHDESSDQIRCLAWGITSNSRSIFALRTGWICYAEKTHGDFILPYISTTRSPQQMMGSLVKRFFASQQVTQIMVLNDVMMCSLNPNIIDNLKITVAQGVEPQRIYHVTVMPCYDKKLEASRTDFYLTEAETREVDCVITSGKEHHKRRNAKVFGGFFRLKNLCMWCCEFDQFLGEVLKMLEEEGVSLSDIEPAPLDTM